MVKGGLDASGVIVANLNPTSRILLVQDIPLLSADISTSVSNIQSSREKVGVDSLDVEKHVSPAAVDSADSDSQSAQGKLSWRTKLIALGIEERGILPVPVEEGPATAS